MIIDFHTHVFPDGIAQKAISTLVGKAGIKPYLYGSLGELKKSMVNAGIDIGVVLPVLTRLSQFESINRYAAEITHKYEEGIELISFGGIHPYSENYKEELRTIKSLGLKGVKIHPDYQDAYFDDPRTIRMIDYASELDLIVVTHAGLDMAYPNTTKCKPKAIKNLLDQIDPPKLVLAHMGGLYFFDEVEELIIGKNVYLDTAYLLGKIKKEQLLRMIRNHGVDKILFASDSPWADQKYDVEYINSLALTDEERNKICYENAKKLLRI